MTMKSQPLQVRAQAVISGLGILAFVAAAPPPSPEPLPSPVVGDVQESYRLLSSSFYRKVDTQVLLDGARTALVDEAHKHGVKVSVPQLHPADDADDTVAALSDEITDVATAAHGATTDYAYAAIDGMAKSLEDRYTAFLTPDEYKAFNNALDPERISGIGVLVQPDQPTGFIKAYYVVPGTPADRAGIRAGDLIEEVDGTSTKNMTNDAVSKLLRGKAGTIVHVTIARVAGGDTQDLALTRSEVQPPTVVFKMLPGDIGYVNVLAFGRATPGEFDVALDRLKDANAKAIVLDLRNDGGGYVDSALDISSRFIANKAIVNVEQRGVPEETIQADNEARVAVPVTVLVNQYTASASEITAGALQDDGIGELVGTRTFGKGVMQTLTPLPDGAAIKITTAHYLTPRHRDINLRGIDPDISVVENRDARFGELDKDAQLRAALDLLQKKIADAPHQ